VDAKGEQQHGGDEHARANEPGPSLACLPRRIDRQRKSHHPNTMQTKPFAALTNVNASFGSIQMRLMRAP
jgi:hypothetical protein